MFGPYIFRRLRSALLPEFRRLWTRDIDNTLTRIAAKEVRDDLRVMRQQLDQLLRFREEVVRREFEQSRAPLLADLDARLDLDRIRTHVLEAIAGATVHTVPTAHVIVDQVLPPDVYELLKAAIPPAALFNDRDPVKQLFETADLDRAPEFARRVWRFCEDAVIGRVLAPALLQRFHPHVVEHYAETGGEAFGRRAAAVTHRTVAGRILLHRPGYSLAPHLDPKRVAITGLLYFPRPGDPEVYGTQLFHVDRPFTASGMKTFFPEQFGMTCTLATTVPYRANTLLAFVNSKAAHGAELPADAPLAERYAYQFYVKPVDGELIKLLKELPADAQAAWGEIL